MCTWHTENGEQISQCIKQLLDKNNLNLLQKQNKNIFDFQKSISRHPQILKNILAPRIISPSTDI